MKKITLLLSCLIVSVGMIWANGSNETTSDKQTSGMDIPSLNEITLGEDYTDIEASLTFLTHRTDIVDTKLSGYIAEFQKLYPNISISYEGVTDYAQDVTVRLTTQKWGDICMIPTTIDKDELSGAFLPLGETSVLEDRYNFLNNFAYNGVVYGMPSTGNAQGIVYNKSVFKKAGITEIPKTPKDFMIALQKIKDNTDAIPLYTNFAAGWTMGAWDAYIGGSATGDPDYMSKLPHLVNPFSNNGKGSGPFAVYNILYEATSKGLIEDDPTTTDWEGCKGMINRGEIGTLVLGSWAVNQMKAAGSNPDDIAYMPFPITVDGKQFASAGPDYDYGINVNATDNNKIASLLYIKWLVEESRFAYSEGGIPIDKEVAYPDLYKDFTGATFVVDNPAPVGEETLFNDINNKSEMGINRENSHIQNIVENALMKTKTMDEIVSKWNESWTDAQTKMGISK